MLTHTQADRRSDSGFTLIELIISIGLLGLIFSVLSLVMLGSMRVNDETKQRLDSTRDEQFVAAYFASDMASATHVVADGSADCGSGRAVVTLVGESFVPTTSATLSSESTATVAAYVFDTATIDGVTTGTLTRRYCEGTGNPPFTTPVETVALAARLAATPPTVTCYAGATAAACSNTTTTISVAFDRLDGGQFTLSGTRRATP